METDIEKWFKEEGERVLKEVGIKKAHTILDFGCGAGTYSLPAAKIVGEEGRIFALDKSRVKLNELIRKAESAGLENIRIMETSGELKIPLRERSIDVVLLYDILHSYYFSLSGRRKLLKEVYRVLKLDGLLSVYPEHMKLKGIIQEIEKTNFHFEKKYLKALIHEDRYTGAHVLNFRK
ncbi:MAG: class I SAM-dependent methyltransferase [Candidatus Aerophobetes bacterium]|nr:class I SAM-dependent methyltransferase [Candidatus Aerophobetes bacterium]